MANNDLNTPAMGSNPSLFGSDDNVNMPQPSTSVLGTIGGTSNPLNVAGTSNVSGRTTFDANMQADSVSPSQTSKPLFKFGETAGQSSSKVTSTSEVPAPVRGVGSSDVDMVNPTSSSLFNAVGSQQTSTPGSTSWMSNTPISIPVHRTTPASSSNSPSSVSGTDIASEVNTPKHASNAEFGATPKTGGPASVVVTPEQGKPIFKFPLPKSSSTASPSGGGSNNTFTFGASSTNTGSFAFNFSMGKASG